MRTSALVLLLCGYSPLLAASPLLLAQEAISVAPDGKVSLDLHDADVRGVIGTLAEVGRVNVVMTDEVQGRVTLKVRNVSWRAALSMVLRVKGLGMLHDGDVVFVAPRAVIRAEHDARKQEAWRCTPDTSLGPLEFCKNP